MTRLQPDEAYLRATHPGAALDLLCFEHGERLGFGLERADTPAPTTSMYIELHDRRLDRLAGVHQCSNAWRLLHMNVVQLGTSHAGAARGSLPSAG